MALGQEYLPVYRPRFLWIDDRDVTGRAGGQRASRQSERISRADTHPVNERRKVDESLSDQVGQPEPQRSFQADDPVGCVGKSLFLFIVVVRSMIRRENVQSPIGQPLTNRFAILR